MSEKQDETFDTLSVCHGNFGGYRCCHNVSPKENKENQVKSVIQALFENDQEIGAHKFYDRVE